MARPARDTARRLGPPPRRLGDLKGQRPRGGGLRGFLGGSSVSPHGRAGGAHPLLSELLGAPQVPGQGRGVCVSVWLCVWLPAVLAPHTLADLGVF